LVLLVVLPVNLSKARKLSYISGGVPGAFLMTNYALQQSQNSGCV